MTRQHGELTMESCNNRHRILNWAIGVMFLFLAALVTIGGWSVVAAYNAALGASAVAGDLRAEQLRSVEYRIQGKEDMKELKIWIKVLSDKQDVTNNMVQRLVVQRESEREKK